MQNLDKERDLISMRLERMMSVMDDKFLRVEKDISLVKEWHNKVQRLSRNELKSTEAFQMEVQILGVEDVKGKLSELVAVCKGFIEHAKEVLKV